MSRFWGLFFFFQNGSVVHRQTMGWRCYKINQKLYTSNVFAYEKIFSSAIVSGITEKLDVDLCNLFIYILQLDNMSNITTTECVSDVTVTLLASTPRTQLSCALVAIAGPARPSWKAVQLNQIDGFIYGHTVTKSATFEVRYFNFILWLCAWASTAQKICKTALLTVPDTWLSQGIWASMQCSAEILFYF